MADDRSSTGASRVGSSVDDTAATSVDSQAQQLLRDLVKETLIERRRARRWSIFFKLLTFAVVALVLAQALSGGTGMDDGSGESHTAVIDINGVIADGEPASAGPVVRALEEALENPMTQGVILNINSPGGSPVQSGILFAAIQRLRKTHSEVPVHAVLGDVAASGGYYVAAAADQIHADKASIVGSIGVRMDSFGATEAMEKLGLERRLLTAGEYKGLLDPFLPEDPEVVAHVQGMLDQIHQQFIDAVKTGRGDRLAKDERLFSGLIWSGEAALDNGLIDALGNVQSVARDVIGEAELVNYTREQDLFTRLADRVGASVAATLRLWSTGQLS